MQVRRMILAFAVAVAGAAPPVGAIAQGIRIIGSGASFPFPIYSA
jgi:hypothetical protein